MIHRNNQDYITAFVEGYICAIIGERMTTAKVSEAELDNAKHSAEKPKKSMEKLKKLSAAIWHKIGRASCRERV